jgi:transcriptional regulator with XRE-family HTH domain
MISQLDNVCPCFGRQLRRLRDEADMGLEASAELTGTAPGVVGEIERGRRAVCSEWVFTADQALRAGGRLRTEAGECLAVHAGMVPGPLNEHADDGTGPVRLPAAFAADAA